MELPNISDTWVLAGSALGLGSASLLFASRITACAAIVAQWRGSKPHDNWYEDDDGKSAPESMAKFSNKTPKLVCLFLAAVAFGASVAISVLGTLHLESQAGIISSWLLTISWVSGNLYRARSADLYLSSYPDQASQLSCSKLSLFALTSPRSDATNSVFDSPHPHLQSLLDSFSKGYSARMSRLIQGALS